jgi:hypothetical protein
VAPEACLQAGRRGSAHAQDGGGLLQTQAGDGRQQNGLGHAQFLEVVRLGDHPLGLGDLEPV